MTVVRRARLRTKVIHSAEFVASAPAVTDERRTSPAGRHVAANGLVASFLAVADRGGFGAATLAVHLSQSRVSAHIAALEHALGVTLFDRKARPIRTTRAGELFRGHALTALLELQRGIEAVRSTLDNLVAHVTIGSYPSVSSTYLPAVLQQLQAKHPDVTVELHEGTAAALEEMVASGTVDLAFRPLLPKMRETALCHRTIWREDIVAVMRESDPLAERASVSVDEVLARPMIGNPAGSEEDGGGFDVRNTLGEAAGRANIAYLTDQPATLVALVRAAFGIRHHQPPRTADHQYRGVDRPHHRLTHRVSRRRAVLDAQARGQRCRRGFPRRPGAGATTPGRIRCRSDRRLVRQRRLVGRVTSGRRPVRASVVSP